ncbi:hypothetical protein O181_026257 [Austropuccinia psidii MF-1]|uniref:Uncharacterized protein n=1 Tax=Austropuccinia psidii MF-1 TaxID=1389203 RepID=A0A9Q3CQ75_9BASI|nr:hypothetical protein [Austropuccinia psidii MF-1]
MADSGPSRYSSSRHGRSRSPSTSRNRNRHERSPPRVDRYDRRRRSLSRERPSGHPHSATDGKLSWRDRESPSRWERNRGRSPSRRRESSSPALARRRRSSSTSSSCSKDTQGEDGKYSKKSKSKKSQHRKRSLSSDSSHDRRRHKETREERKERKRKKREKKERKEKKKKKKEKAHKQKHLIDEYGKYGIISEADMYTKDQEFRAWMVEERMLNPETVPQAKMKELFRAYMEDYNTATLPHEKYYALEKYEAKMNAIRSGFTATNTDTYDPRADEAALAAQHKRVAKTDGEVYIGRAQLEDLRRIERERVEASRMKRMGMEVKESMGVRYERD